MPHRIALVTDSTCDIPAHWIEQYEITVVPLTIHFGDEHYLEGVEMTAEEFYERLPKDRVHPTTSNPSPQSFTDAYHKAAECGAEQVLGIFISSAMSGTSQSAQLGAQESPIPVKVINSNTNSMGLGWQVIAAARAREAGGDLEAMCDAAEQAQRRMAYYISLDTIEYLARGGRFGEAARLLNSIVQIKPLIYVKHETGTVGASLPARSRKSAIDGMYKEFFKHIDTTRPMHLTVLHNAALPEAEELAERVRQEYHPVELFISIVSPVLGVHTGPRAVALCGYAE
jgi:DegV family protein with EDD domain